MKTKIKEKELLYNLYNYLKTQATFITTNNKKITILNEGTINPYEGPDIINVCYLINNNIEVGNAEIDLKSSFWKTHNHISSDSHKNTKLHFVYENDREYLQNTIIIDNFNTAKPVNQTNYSDISYLELEIYAIDRLNKKIKLAEEQIENGLTETWTHLFRLFFDSIIKKRIRPILKKELTKINFDLQNSIHYLIICNNLSYNELNKLKYFDKQINLEIYLNCVLPILILTNSNKYELLNWYWSYTSKRNYGKLSLRFPNISQKYIWQQQALLEYIECNNLNNHLIKEEVYELCN